MARLSNPKNGVTVAMPTISAIGKGVLENSAKMRIWNYGNVFRLLTADWLNPCTVAYARSAVLSSPLLIDGVLAGHIFGDIKHEQNRKIFR